MNGRKCRLIVALDVPTPDGARSFLDRLEGATEYIKIGPRLYAMGGVPFGTKLRVGGTVYTVEDRGTPYGHVDIFFDTHSEALAFGLKYMDVYQLD